MFNRLVFEKINEQLTWSPAMVILGPRQVGKTRLTQQVAAQFSQSLYLDLERPQAQAKLEQADAFFQANRDRLQVPDEIQTMPDIFSQIRSEIDAGQRPGWLLILGSASFKLLGQSHSLAGRLSLVDMTPLLLSEVYTQFSDTQMLWLRGGFPGIYTAPPMRPPGAGAMHLYAMSRTLNWPPWANA